MSNILIVDDDIAVQNLLQHYLQKEGYFVMVAISGEEALGKDLEVVPDVIILDKIMGGIDGLQVANILKSESSTKYIRVIMLSGCKQQADIQAGLDAGADDYITKPFQPQVLLAKVRSQLRTKTLIDHLSRENNLLKNQINLLTKKVKELNKNISESTRKDDINLELKTELFHEEYSELQKIVTKKTAKWSSELKSIRAKGINSVLFICNANLFRSPIAEVMLKSHLQKLQIKHVDIKSSGVQKGIGGDRLTDSAIQALSKLNIDLTNHSSLSISNGLVQNADLILVMENVQKDVLKKMFPLSESKTFLLSEFRQDELSGKEIADPIGKNKSLINYRLCSYEISISITGLSAFLAETAVKGNKS